MSDFGYRVPGEGTPDDVTNNVTAIQEASGETFVPAEEAIAPPPDTEVNPLQPTMPGEVQPVESDVVQINEDDQADDDEPPAEPAPDA